MTTYQFIPELTNVDILLYQLQIFLKKEQNNILERYMSCIPMFFPLFPENASSRI